MAEKMGGRSKSLATCLTFAWVVWAFANTASTGFGQQTAEELKDFGRGVVLVQSPEDFAEHATNLLVDLGYGGFQGIARQFFQFEDDVEYDRSRPVAIYLDQRGTELLTQVSISDLARFRDRAGTDDVEVPFGLKDPGFEFFLLGTVGSMAVVSEDRLGLASDRELLFQYRDAAPVDPHLQPSLRKLVNSGGLVFLGKVPDDEEWGKLVPEMKREISPEESELLGRIQMALRSADRVASSVTYERPTLWLESLVSLTDVAATEAVFDYEASQSTPFEPTAGLVAEDLLASFSLEVDSLQTPLMVRLLAEWLQEQEGLLELYPWADEGSVQIGFDLLADSWQDLRGVRIGLYRPGDEISGAFCLVGVLDAKEPDRFLDEVRKLATLAGMEDSETDVQIRDAEIESLIEQLGAPKFTTRERASTRLKLAGERAESLLRRAASESSSAEVRRRATQLLAFIGRRQRGAAVTLAADANQFWGDLQPRFSMTGKTVEFAGVPAQLLRIHADPAKSPEDRREATDVMIRLFGNGWDGIPFARVGDRFVFMIGSDPERWKATVANLQNGRDPLADIRSSRGELNRPVQFQLNLSVARWVNTWYGDKFAEPFAEDASRISSLELSLGRQVWGVTGQLPIDELSVLLQAYFAGVRW